MKQIITASIVIPTLNRREKLHRLIDSIIASDFPLENTEIIVVDNGSTDGTVDDIKSSFPHVILLIPGTNLKSGGGRDYGASRAVGKYIFFIDDDNVIEKSCISILVNHFETHPNDGVIAPLMLNFNDRDIIWCAGAKLSRFGKAEHLYSDISFKRIELPKVISDVGYFPNFYATSRKLFEKGLRHDSKNFPHNWAEVDYCISAQKQGYKLAMVTDAITWHDIGYRSKLTRISLFNAYDQPRSRIVLVKKYEKNFFVRLYFYLIFIPGATVYSFISFFKQNEQSRARLMSNYILGIYDGFMSHPRQK